MQEIEKRLNELEIKYSFQDTLVSELNLIVADQQLVIDSLKTGLKRLNEELSQDGNTQKRSLRDDLPPHY